MTRMNSWLARAAATAVLAAALVCLASGAMAAALINKDEVAYHYAIYWEDLEPTIKGVIGPGDTVLLRDSRCIIELVDRHDNIYMRPKDKVYVIQGILGKDPNRPRRE